MSQIFYESDNLTITGSGWCWNNGEVIKWTIRLIFSIHINWKLKTFFHEFELERNEVYSEPSCTTDPSNYYVLKNWYAWNAVHETLQSLWYMVDERASIMNSWTRRVNLDCDGLWVNSPIPPIEKLEP